MPKESPVVSSSGTLSRRKRSYPAKRRAFKRAMTDAGNEIAGKMLTRMGGFQSKTQPNLLTARQGSPASGPLMFVKALKNGHPGHKARHWTANIYKTMPARGRASIEKHMAIATAK